jgi:acetyltransferase-like isoleucine patch superfamily enzyme
VTLVYLLIGLLPSFLQRPIRNALGATIESGARISPFTLITVKDLRMARGARIGAFVRIKATTIVMERNARIRSLSMFKVRHLQLGRDSLIDPMVLVNSDFGPRSRLECGRHVRIFSFSVIEPSEGVYIGDQTGLGGHTLIFCHGSWPNYLEGAPYARGPVRLADQVWIPWRVMILPNAEIGSGAIIGAHSLVRGKVPARSLYSGVPAKLIAENVWTPIESDVERERRLQEAVESFHLFHEGRLRGKIDILPIAQMDAARPEMETVLYSFSEIERGAALKATANRQNTVIDLKRLLTRTGGPLGRQFVHHLATFGVRLSEADPEEL